LDAVGIFDTCHKAFLEAAGQFRPQMHWYCARVAGSAMDGEAIMQEVLLEAYRRHCHV
jgi:RNA polymerase sigma-70 factor (ECF subfamily)